MSKPLTKQEWLSYLEQAWDAAQKEAWSEQPRKWVGLTDEDVTWLCNTAKSHEQTWGMFVRAIEAKLREKNNG